MGKSTINGPCSMATLNYQRVCYCFSCVVIMSAQANEAAQAGSQQRDLHRHLGGGVFFSPTIWKPILPKRYYSNSQRWFYEGWINKGKIFNKMPDGFPFPPEGGQFFQLIQMSKPGLSGSKYTGRAAAAAVGDESQWVQLRCCDLEMISKMGDEAPNLWQKQE